MVTSLLVFTRIVSNPLSNVFHKKLAGNSAHPVFIILVTYILLSLAIAGNTLIVAALRLTDLSILGPINPDKSIISLLLGIYLLGKVPETAQESP